MKRNTTILGIFILITLFINIYLVYNKLQEKDREKNGLVHYYNNKLIIDGAEKKLKVYNDLTILIDSNGDSLVYDSDTLTNNEKKIIYDIYTRFSNYGNDVLLSIMNEADSLDKVIEDSLNRIE